MCNTKISIALATYNGARYLPEQLDSYLAQERLPDELIVSDDCSTDATQAVVEEFARRAPFPVKLFRNEHNLGVARNFANAVSQCSGEIVCLSDQDDIWIPSRIGTLAECFRQNAEVLAVCSNSEQIDGNGLKKGINTWQDCSGFRPGSHDRLLSDPLRVLLAYRGICSAHGLAVHRRVLDVAFPIPPQTPEAFPFTSCDTYLALLAGLIGRVVFHSEPLTLYRRHETNTSDFNPVPIPRLIRNNVGASTRYDTRLQQLLATLRIVEERQPAAITKEMARRVCALIKHYSSAIAARQTGLSGFLLVLRLAVTGSYHRNGRGFRQIAADVLDILSRPLLTRMPADGVMRQNCYRTAMVRLKGTTMLSVRMPVTENEHGISQSRPAV